MAITYSLCNFINTCWIFHYSGIVTICARMHILGSLPLGSMDTTEKEYWHHWQAAVDQIHTYIASVLLQSAACSACSFAYNIVIYDIHIAIGHSQCIHYLKALCSDSGHF